jgi:hypothetical protein
MINPRQSGSAIHALSLRLLVALAVPSAAWLEVKAAEAALAASLNLYKPRSRN